MAHNFKDLEDAVWNTAAGSNPKLQLQLKNVLDAHRSKRSPKDSWWTQLLLNPVGVGSVVLAAAGLLLQCQSTEVERSLVTQRHKMEIRTKLMDSYLKADSPLAKLAVLETAEAIPSVMQACEQDETPAAGEGGVAADPVQSEPIGGARSESERIDCMERKQAAAWVRRQRDILRDDQELRDNLRAEALSAVASTPDQMDADDPGNALDQQAIEQEVSRLATASKLQGGVGAGSGPKKPLEAADESPREKARQLWLLGYDAYGKGRVAAATDFYKQSLLADPSYHAPLNSLGRLAVEEGRIEDGIEYYERALKADPGYQVALYNRALAYGRLGKVNEAKSAWKHAVEQAPRFVNRESLRRRLAAELGIGIQELP